MDSFQLGPRIIQPKNQCKEMWVPATDQLFALRSQHGYWKGDPSEAVLEVYWGTKEEEAGPTCACTGCLKLKKKTWLFLCKLATEGVFQGYYFFESCEFLCSCIGTIHSFFFPFFFWFLLTSLYELSINIHILGKLRYLAACKFAPDWGGTNQHTWEKTQKM